MWGGRVRPPILRNWLEYILDVKRRKGESRNILKKSPKTNLTPTKVGTQAHEPPRTPRPAEVGKEKFTLSPIARIQSPGRIHMVKQLDTSKYEAFVRERRAAVIHFNEEWDGYRAG